MDSGSSAARVANLRAKLRAMGLKPVQRWVPDTSSQEFRARWRRSADRIRSNDAYQRDLDLLDDLNTY